MRVFIICLAGVAGSAAVRAEDPEPFPARAAVPKHPIPHTEQRAGTDGGPSKRATLSVEPHEAGGWVGGGRNVLRLFGTPAEATRKSGDGTFGWDYVGLGRRPGRIFMGWYNDSPHQTPFLPRYASDGPRIKDPVAAMPIKRAIKEAKEEKRSGGKEE